MNSALRHRLELIAARVLRRLFLRTTVQEMLHREQFFYDAAQYLAFNGIDGDYVEFGCHGGRTFAMAYHQFQKHGSSARLWAYDSFQGLPAPDSANDDHPVWTAGNMRTELDEFHRLCAARGV
ncbi:MAG TPA: TylF/MycF/NovP-related O-methyltransferase, partial [Candidatus Binatia bacterium]|nr:TylF/MycF/NovP-related O-methyltransferase [Candidatus Binatia bacterium]